MASAMSGPSSSTLPALSALELFSGVRPGLFASYEQVEYRDKQMLLEEGAAADKLIVLVRGTAEVRVNGVHIVNRTAVQVIGEQAFIENAKRTATVIACGPVVTYEFNANAADALLRDTDFLRNLVKVLSQKLREATADRGWRYRSEELLFGTVRQHVSAEVLQDLLRTGDLGQPRQTEVVALFADIRGFTAATLRVAPDRLAEDLSRYLELAVSVVHGHKGMIDKFIGDGVMALWGYRPDAQDAANAIAAAHDLVVGASKLTVDGEVLRVGIGIESGIAMLGVIGPEGKREFTAIGPSINLAARLQDATKELGAPIAVGPDLAAKLPPEWRDRLGAPNHMEIRGVGTVAVAPLTAKE
jgi:class 3 adenylate cyclase